MCHEFRHPIFGVISKEEAVRIVKTRDCSRKKWIQYMMKSPYRYGDILKKMSTSERLVTLRTIKLDVGRMIMTYSELEKGKFDGLRNYSAALLLLSSEYVDVRSQFDEMLDHSIICEMVVVYGVEFFPLKALLILGYDLSSSKFVEQIARNECVIPKNLGDNVEDIIGSVCSRAHMKKIDDNWNFITYVMFLYFGVKPDDARKEYLMCSFPNEYPLEPYDLDACYFVPASDVCTNCESYGNLCVRYREFLENITLFELTLAQTNKHLISVK
jgi:hypothetical protein